MADFPLLACSEVLLRVVLYDDYITRDGEIKWQAFRRREPDTDGVSLFFREADIANHLTNPYPGLLTVHAGRVRDVAIDGNALDVVQNLIDHAIIDKMPYPYDKTGEERVHLEELGIRYARQLAKTAARILNFAPLKA